jgi:hypothetical protein
MKVYQANLREVFDFLDTNPGAWSIVIFAVQERQKEGRPRRPPVQSMKD